MVLTNIQDFKRYEGLNPYFKVLADYLEGHDLLAAELGRIVIDGDNLFINNVKTEGVPADKQVLEMHKSYIDIHILLQGSETIGIKATGKVASFSKEYDEAGDYMLSEEKADCYVQMHPGDMIICFPEDAHAPVIGSGPIRKAIAKVRCVL
jgi:YhcH/YjgK/YiaL family protein